MALEITSSKTQLKYVKCLIYGDSGNGKTYICSTAPNPIIISAEDGLLSISDFDLPVIKVKNLREAEQAFKIAKEGPYDTICLDSLSELAELILEEYKPQEKDPRKAYLRMGDDLTKFLRKIRALEKHVVVLVKLGTLTDDFTESTVHAPGVPGKAFTQQLPYFLDLVLCLKVDIKGTRFLQTQPDLQYKAKDRSGKLKVKEEPNLTQLFQKILGAQEDGTTPKG